MSFYRSDIDDVPRFLFEHIRDDCLYIVNRPKDIRLPFTKSFLIIDLTDILDEILGNTGIIHEDIDASDFSDELIEVLLYCLFIGYIEKYLSRSGKFTMDIPQCI